MADPHRAVLPTGLSNLLRNSSASWIIYGQQLHPKQDGQGFAFQLGYSPVDAPCYAPISDEGQRRTDPLFLYAGVKSAIGESPARWTAGISYNPLMLADTDELPYLSVRLSGEFFHTLDDLQSTGYAVGASISYNDGIVYLEGQFRGKSGPYFELGFNLLGFVPLLKE